MPATLQRPPVSTVLPQHLEDSAFCWLRRQGGLWGPAFKAEHVRRFDLLLDAHLEGLRIAGAVALAPALAAFEKFLTPDEAFVSTYVLAHNPDTKSQEDLERLLLENPEAAPGAASALLWSTPEAASPLLRAWEGREDGLLRRIALPVALRDEGEPAAFSALRNPATLARALRACGEFRIQDPALHLGLSDADPEVRLEAILALAILGDASPVESLPELITDLRPSTLKRALLAWGTLASENLFGEWMGQKDPATIRLRIWAAAFRGDGAWIPFLAEQVPEPKTAQLAAYALGHITGMDVDLDGLDKPNTEEAEDASGSKDPQEAENPEDTGLLEPDPEKVQSWLGKHVMNFPAGRRFLAGASLEEAQKVLATGWQPQRHQAAFLLAQKGNTEPLRQMSTPSFTPFLYTPVAPAPPQEEDWKTAMMRGVREKARNA